MQAVVLTAGAEVALQDRPEPAAVAVRAVAHGRVRAGTAVAVVGAGAIGQLILQLAVNAGTGEATVVETSAPRRRVASAALLVVTAGVTGLNLAVIGQLAAGLG
jgi:threonine dehydrogenase-like Zn-dependent dehydrogenase